MFKHNVVTSLIPAFSIWHQFVTIFFVFYPHYLKKSMSSPQKRYTPLLKQLSPCLFFLLDAASSFISFLFSLSFCSFFFSFVLFF